MESVIIPRHVLTCREYKVVQARRKACVAIDRLVDWIVRETDPADRRKKHVRPTPAVEPVWKRMTACARKIRGRAMHGLSADEIDRTRSTLNTILENLDSPVEVRERVS